MGTDYFNLLKKSWQGFRKNLVLLLPILMSIGLFIGFLVVLGLEMVIFVLVFSESILSQPAQIFSSPVGVVMLILFGFADLVLMLMLSSYISSMQIGMNKDVVEKGKTSSSNMFKYGRLYFTRYLKYAIIRFLITFVPALILGLIVYVIFLESRLLAIFTGIIAFFIFFAYAMALALGLFFIEPMLVFRKEKLTDLIKHSIDYTKKNTGHVLLTCLVMFAVSICVSIALMVFLVPLNVLESVLKDTGPSSAFIFTLVLKGLFQIARVIVNTILGIVLDLFMFNAYFVKRAK